MAVRRSQVERKIKEAEQDDGFTDSLSTVRVVGSKTFLMKDGVWVDTEYKADTRLPKVDVTFGSEEFFKLVADKPELAEFFALGKKVIVVLDGKVYQSS